MKRYTAIKMFKVILVLFATIISVVYTKPLDDDFDTVMVDDNIPAESIQLQDFQTFYNVELENNAMSELQMEESRGSAHIRPPQALSEKEKRIRQNEIYYDVQREKRNQLSLKKGNTKPNTAPSQPWEEFDYDSHVNQG